MKRLNQEMSPLRDDSTKDAAYVRDMWSEYTKRTSFQEQTRTQHMQRDPEQVHAYLKTMEEGIESEDAQTLRKVAEGQIQKDDSKMQNYLIKQFQKKRYWLHAILIDTSLFTL